MKQANIKLDKLQEFTATNKLGNYKDLLPDFVIDKRPKGAKLCLKKFNKFHKQTDAMAITSRYKGSEGTTCTYSIGSESMLVVETKSFLDTMITCDVDFEDTGLHNFLTSDTLRVLSITTPDIEMK
ncbi:Protein of unknown function [Gryllus bimaculatus]|nr:Protein of unknown function [Gryllus bimaculatus]